MASRSAGVGWFAVGFLAGVGATLAAIIIATRPQPMRVNLPTPQAPAAPVVTYHAPKLAAAAALPAPTPTQTPAAPAPRTTASAPDRQTQDDAAAAGMTSRARPAG